MAEDDVWGRRREAARPEVMSKALAWLSERQAGDPHFQAVVELEVVARILTSDARRTLQAAQDASDAGDGDEMQYQLRQSFRTNFALVEGLTFRMKQLAGHSTTEFSRAERALLLNESYGLNSKGEAHVKEPKLEFGANVRFAFSTYAKYMESPFVLDVNGREWSQLLECAIVRNRLMHPKSSTDLQIKQNEADALRDAIGWFVASFRKLLERAPDVDWDAIERFTEDRAVGPLNSTPNTGDSGTV